MARLASEQLMGFFALPNALAPLIAERIALEADGEDTRPYRIIDPCCGEGKALADITAALRERATAPIETYGIELHPGRAGAAAERLDRVTQGDIFAAETGAFSAVYLNPPYVNGTMELRFLTRSLDMMQPDALLILVIQKKTVRNCARLLASNFQDITIREFPMPERDMFGQIVLTARKNDFVASDPQTEESLRLYAESEFGNPALQYSPDDVPLPMRPSRFVQTPHVRVRIHSPEHIVQISRASGFWTDPDILSAQRPTESGVSGRPLAPLRMGHLAQYCAAGLINNTLIEDFVISGTATKTKVTTEEENQTVITETMKLTLMALDLKNWTTYQIN